jgi:hypothetical protein
MVDFRLLSEPQRGTSIVNQQSKINNQKFTPTTQHSQCGDGRLGRPSDAEGKRPGYKSYPATTRFQYARRGKVTVVCAAQPCFRSRSVARTAASREANRPYNVDPEPDNEAYFAPAHKSAFFPRLSSGCSGKTTCSKSFLIPARTSQRSGFSARPPLTNSEGALEYCPPSHADNL